MHHLEDMSDIFIIGDSDIEVESAYGVSGNIGKLGLNESLVRNSDRAVVEGAKGEGEKTDGVDSPGNPIYLDDVAELKWPLPDHEKPADDIRK